MHTHTLLKLIGLGMHRHATSKAINGAANTRRAAKAKATAKETAAAIPMNISPTKDPDDVKMKESSPSKRPKDAESNENRKKSKITGETENIAKALFTEDEEMEDPFISTQPNKQLFDTFNHMLGAPDDLLLSLIHI